MEKFTNFHFDTISRFVNFSIFRWVFRGCFTLGKIWEPTLLFFFFNYVMERRENWILSFCIQVLINYYDRNEMCFVTDTRICCTSIKFYFYLFCYRWVDPTIYLSSIGHVSYIHRQTILFILFVLTLNAITRIMLRF